MAITPGDLADILRLQAWERAKAELRGVLHTYHPEPCATGRKDEAFKKAKEKIDAFIVDFEGWCM